MNMPKPSEAHRKLEMLVGNWIGDEKLHPSPWDPQGGAAIGRVHNRLALDGFAVVQDYEQERSGRITFRGHALFRWDQGQQCYVSHWFDSMDSPPNEFKGNFAGKVLTLTCLSAQGQSRSVFDFSEPKTYTFRMEVSPDGSKWITFMEGKYRKEE